VKIFAPPTNCVVPIGADLLLKGLQREITAEFYSTSLRPPAVYRGNPFQVEVGLAYGGSLRAQVAEEESLHDTGKAVEAAQGPITLLRMANRVPLQYQQSACATFKAVSETNWRQYGLPHPKGSLPQGSMVLLVHIASVWVPFTSESKEAVAHYAEILKEIRLALQEAGRKLGSFLRKREHVRNAERRRGIFQMYIGELVQSLGNLTPINQRELQKQRMDMAIASTGQAGDEEDVQAAIGPSRLVDDADDVDAMREEQEGLE
jgi:DNA topoisomerase-6 subunit B